MSKNTKPAPYKWADADELEAAKMYWKVIGEMFTEKGRTDSIDGIKWVIELYGAQWAFDNGGKVMDDIPQHAQEILLMAYRYYEHTLVN